MNSRPFVFAILLLATGCASYRTPGSGAHVTLLSKSDADIADVMKRQPVAPFPSRVAIVRTQASGYYSNGNSCYGNGAYCVVTTRDVESEQDFERIARLPMVAGLAPLGSILLPKELKSLRDLRLAAAELHADLLLVYTLDTRFNVESTDVGPLSLITLGFLKNKRAHVSTTASAALIDVRTGFVYGVAEGSALEQQSASVWTSRSAIDNARLKTEAASFQKLLGEFETLWAGIVNEHAKRAATS